MNGQPISDTTWAGIRAEFTLPALAQVYRRLSELMEDPGPVMRQLVAFSSTTAPSARDSNSSLAGAFTDGHRTVPARWN